MNFQYIIVIGIILAAIVYAGTTFRKLSHSFSTKAGCGDDCGCNGHAKKLTS